MYKIRNTASLNVNARMSKSWTTLRWIKIFGINFHDEWRFHWAKETIVDHSRLSWGLYCLGCYICSTKLSILKYGTIHKVQLGHLCFQIYEHLLRPVDIFRAHLSKHTMCTSGILINLNIILIRLFRQIRPGRNKTMTWTLLGPAEEFTFLNLKYLNSCHQTMPAPRWQIWRIGAKSSSGGRWKMICSPQWSWMFSFLLLLQLQVHKEYIWPVEYGLSSVQIWEGNVKFKQKKFANEFQKSTNFRD